MLFPYGILALDHQLILGRAVRTLIDAIALLALLSVPWASQRNRTPDPGAPFQLSPGPPAPASPAAWEHWSAAQPQPCRAMELARLDSDLLIDVLF